MQQTLHTARLTLRPCAETDLAQLHQHWTEPAVRKYLWDDRIISQDIVREVLTASLAASQGHRLGLWVLLGRRDGVFRGVCGLRDSTLAWPELLYSIAPPYWGDGLATEAARGVLRHAFEDLAWQRVLATVDAPNLASIRVLEKLGMTVTETRVINGNLIRYYELARANVV